jgi:uncharacterized RDD family membrane protein YckC
VGARILAIIAVALSTLSATLLACYPPTAHAQPKSTESKADSKSPPNAAPVPWNKVPQSERRVLSPLEKDWKELPGSQQRRLIGAAKQYPKLAPIQQERFQERLKEWSTLTPAQRHDARDKYKNLSSLPPAKQQEIREIRPSRSPPSAVVRLPDKLEAASPSPSPTVTPLAAPTIKRRLVAMLYESLLLLALLFIASFPAAGLKGATLSGLPHDIFQAYLLVVMAAYFTWLWRHGGQTLPMKTWRFKLLNAEGRALTLTQALSRFMFALLFFGPAWVGMLLQLFPERVPRAISIWAFLPMLATVLWARFDPDRQFLHDRMAGTRLVNVSAG